MTHLARQDLVEGDEVIFKLRGKEHEGVVEGFVGDKVKVKRGDGKSFRVAQSSIVLPSEAEESEPEDEPPVKSASSWETKYDFPEKQITMAEVKKRKAEVPECFGECGIKEEDPDCAECPLSKACFKETHPEDLEEQEDESEDVMKTLSKGRRRNR